MLNLYKCSEEYEMSIFSRRLENASKYHWEKNMVRIEELVQPQNKQEHNKALWTSQV